MRLTSRAEYGVRSMLFLALHYDRETVPLKEIAHHEKISYQYLEQIFPRLRRSGLVESTRGVQGGYRLLRTPGEITVGDIIRAVEGPIAPAKCLQEHDAACCRGQENCVTRSLWEKLRDNVVGFLDSISLLDMVKWSHRGKPQPKEG